MGQNLDIRREKVLDGEVVAAGQSALSTALKLTRIMPDGFFALELEVSGDGAAQFDVAVAIGDLVPGEEDNQTFIVPSTESPIAVGLIKTSGENSDGKDYFSFSPVVATDIKIKVTETGSSDSITVTAYVIIQ